MAKITCNFISYTLKRAVDITVIIPTTTIPESLMMDPSWQPTHEIKEKYPVVYLLHGYGNNHATWSGYSNIELYAEERNIAVVMLSAENKAYNNVSEEDHYYDFLSEELPQFVTSMFPISTKKEDTYMAGLSMGGYGTLVHGLTHPERFNAIGSFSGAVSMLNGKEGAYDVMTIIKQLLETKQTFPQMYIACGKDDFLYDANVQLVEFLKKNNVSVTVDFVEGYAHEWRFWDMEVERFLDWLNRQDIYANKKRKV